MNIWRKHLSIIEEIKLNCIPQVNEWCENRIDVIITSWNDSMDNCLLAHCENVIQEKFTEDTSIHEHCINLLYSEMKCKILFMKQIIEAFDNTLRGTFAYTIEKYKCKLNNEGKFNETRIQSIMNHMTKNIQDRAALFVKLYEKDWSRVATSNDASSAFVQYYKTKYSSKFRNYKLTV